MPSSSVPDSFVRGCPSESAASMWKWQSTKGGATRYPAASITRLASARMPGSTAAMRPSRIAMSTPLRPSGSAAFATMRSKLMTSFPLDCVFASARLPGGEDEDCREPAREEHEQHAHRVDGRRRALAHLAVHVDRQRRLGADEHQRGVEVLERHQERDEPRPDHRRPQVGQGHGPEHAPRAGAEIEGRLLERPVEAPQPRRDDQRREAEDEGELAHHDEPEPWPQDIEIALQPVLE